MSFIGGSFLKKAKKNNDLLLLKEKLEKSIEYIEQLKENIIYSQQLAHTGSWTYDIKKGEIFRSEEVYRILRCRPENLDNKLESYYSYVHQDDMEKVKEADRQILEGKETYREYRIVTPEGTERYIQEKTKILLDSGNNPIKVIGIIQDITEQKMIENNLRALEEDFEHAQRVAGVGIWKYDIKKDEFFGTKEMFRIYGIEPSIFKNDFVNTINLVHPEDQAKLKKALEKHIEGKSCEVEFRIPQKDGTNKYVIGKGEPLFDKEGLVVGVIGTLQDITGNKILEQKLKKYQRMLDQAQALSHVGSWEMDLTSNMIYWSEETYKIFGVTSEDYDNTYEGFLKFVHPEDIEKIESILKSPSKKPVELEFRIIRSDGDIRDIFELVKFIFDEKGSPSYLYGTIQDITEKKRLQEEIELKQNEINKIQKRFQLLIHESNDVFEILAQDGTIKYVSQASERVIGYKPEERIGKKVYEYYEGLELQKLTEMIEFVLGGARKKAQRDIIIKNKLGEDVYLEVYMQNLLNDPAIEGIVVNFRDITHRVKMEKKIAHIANHDELTGLPNMIYFKKQLKALFELAKEKPAKFAVMILDIDGFKYLNNALGYSIGDQLIIEVTQRIKSYLSDSDFFCRYSGDRFAIIAQSLSTFEEYKSTAEGIAKLFNQTFIVEKYELDIFISMGISIYDENNQDPDQLVKNAETALFWAKKDGKNRFRFFSSDISIQDYKHFQLRNDLRRALENNQLRVYYQPLVNIRTNEILAVEVLIRWEHPDWGIISPKEFISIAEETGLIVNIGYWLLGEVCRTYRKWLNDGLEQIRISVNFSSIQFFENNFVENIKKIIDEFQLNPDFLIIEITESILMEKSDKAISNIKRLQSFGMQVAIDDFGTGFSSLSYLNNFSIDIIKMDSSFIKNIYLNETNTIITRYLINMARELRIKTVAEGIENWDQLSFLRELNCNAGQGYLYSKPVPQHEIEKILAQKKCKPVVASNAAILYGKNRRRFFRIKFPQLLESNLTILEINGKKINVGNTKVLVKDIGPGGLCFISNIKLPVERGIILQFITYLLGKEIKVYGSIVRAEEIDNGLNEYGVEFTIDENEREGLIRILNQVQIKMKNNIMFAEGSFITCSPNVYFKTLNN